MTTATIANPASNGATDGTTTTTWMPRSGHEEIAGLMWLPRMLDKARRRLEGEPYGQDTLWPYMFGDNDFIDARLLTFLRLTGDQVLDVVRETPDDAAAAAELVRRSGRTAQEIAEWTAQFRAKCGFFLSLFDADEGRSTGPMATLRRWFYNGVIMPPANVAYRRAEQRRRRATGA